MSQKKTYVLEQGYLFFGDKSYVIRTVVGSCVVVCISDSVLKTGAMNHFMYPKTKNPKETTVKFGNIAIRELIKLMKINGSKKSSLTAQIFGGSFPAHATGRNIGAENVEIAKKELKRYNIKVTSEDVGGELGRKIVFDVESGEIIVLKVNKLRQDDWHSFMLKKSDNKNER